MTLLEICDGIRERLARGEETALDVGCGLKRAEPGAVGMDAHNLLQETGATSANPLFSVLPRTPHFLSNAWRIAVKRMHQSVEFSGLPRP